MQLIVLGMHRSGTSVLARLLNLMGAYFGPEGASTGANPENPKGFWERRDVRVLNDHVLHSVGCDWNRVLGFNPSGLPDALVSKFIRRASSLVLEMDAHRPWMLKEPRLCLLLPLWRKVLEVPACIHVYRDPVEVAASLRARNGIPIEAGMALWERYVRAALDASAGLPSVVISHRQLMKHPVQAVNQLLRRLEVIGEAGLHMPAQAEVNAFVQSDLYRQKAGNEDLCAYRNAPQVRLFEQLTCDGPCPGNIMDVGMDAASERALAAYESSLPPLVPKPQSTPRAATTSAKPEVLRCDLARGDAALPQAAGEHASLREALNRAERAGLDARRDLAARFEETAELTRMLLERDERIAQLKARQRLIARERDEARAACETARLQIEENQNQAANALAAAAAAAKDVDAKLRVQRRQLEHAMREAASLVSQVGRLDASLQAARACAADSDQRIASITGSLSWRLTSPLRAVKRWLRKQPAENRERNAAVAEIRASGVFDASWYLDRNPDVSESGVDPVEHYFDHGALEGRDPGPTFDARRYQADNPDVIRARANPLLHFIRHGRNEVRRPRSGGGVVDR